MRQTDNSYVIDFKAQLSNEMGVGFLNIFFKLYWAATLTFEKLLVRYSPYIWMRKIVSRNLNTRIRKSLSSYELAKSLQIETPR